MECLDRFFMLIQFFFVMNKPEHNCVSINNLYYILYLCDLDKDGLMV